uniref:Uncharacterized protein n=5 Tax=Vespinae TaxID=7439 RepID=A0A834PEW9_VESPE|nr:hypothetical protein H0235_000791 [Vespula pensylvanica]
MSPDSVIGDLHERLPHHHAEYHQNQNPEMLLPGHGHRSAESIENDSRQQTPQPGPAGNHHPNSSSAFTPISSISINSISSMQHPLNPLNHLHYPASHHPASRPYLYEAFNSTQKSSPTSSSSGVTSGTTSNQNATSFPNQLISLHQIRNYAHQPNLGNLGNLSNLGNLGNLSSLNATMESHALLGGLKEKQ